MESSTNEIKLTIMTEDASIVFEVSVSPRESVDHLKSIVQATTSIPANQQLLVFNNQRLDGNRSLSDYSVEDQSLIFLSKVNSRRRVNDTTGAMNQSSSRRQSNENDRLSVMAQGLQNFFGGNVSIPNINSNIQPTPSISPSDLRQRFNSDQSFRFFLNDRDTELFEALSQPDDNIVSQLIIKRDNEKIERERRQNQLLSRLDTNPFDVEAQKELERIIKQRNIDENYRRAYEEMPELLTRVFMLYVKIEVNNVPVTAFVDSGAQMTVMSAECAERCNILHLLDERFSGIAVGIGHQKILGKVHMATVKFGNILLTSSFTVLEGQSIQFLLGLDMLRRHKGVIDLGNNTLTLEGETLHFLGESEIPEGDSKPVSDEIRKQFGFDQVENRSQGQPQPTSQTISTQQPSQRIFSQEEERNIKKLMEIGATRELAIEALTVTDNDVEKAAAYLYQSLFTGQ